MNENKQQKEIENNGVSVIIPTYNRAHFITKTMDSVWEQTYRPIEMLIVDDGSTDATGQVVGDWIRRYSSDTFIVKYILQENAGAPAARNNGLRHAKGRYLQFLDSDDWFISKKLSLQIDLMEKEKTSICTCNAHIENEAGEILATRKFNVSVNKILQKALSVLSPVPVIDRNRLKNIKLEWNEHLLKGQDKDFFLKTLLQIEKRSHLNKDLFIWIWHSGERIGHKNNGTKVHWAILKSIFSFTLKYHKQIPRKRYFSVFILHLRLLYASTWIRTIVRFVRSGGKEFPT